MEVNAFVVRYFTFNGGEYDMSTFKGSIGCFNNAEEIVIHVCKICSIGPIVRHLFALYSPSKKLWISPNHPACAMDPGLRDLQLKIRFCPTEPVNLLKLDSVAFEYYFAQMRYDFLGACVKKPDNELLGLSTTLMIVHVFEKDLLADTALDFVKLQDFVPKGCFNNKTGDSYLEKFANTYQKSQGRKLIEILKSGWIKAIQNQDGIPAKDFVKAEFISTVFRFGVEANLLKELSDETFELKKRSENGDWYSIQLRFEVYKLTLSWCLQGVWEKISHISEVESLFIHLDTLRIGRTNGYPIKIKGSIRVLFSLCSLLEGFYRFTVNPSRCLFIPVMPPSIAFMQENSIFGPISFNLAEEKLKKSGRGSGTLIFAMDRKKYLFNLYALVGERVISFKIDTVTRNHSKEFIIIEYGNVYESIAEIQEKLQIPGFDNESLRHLLRPRGCDVLAQTCLFKKVASLPLSERLTSKPGLPEANLAFRLKTAKLLSSDGSFKNFLVHEGGEGKVWKVLKKDGSIEISEFVKKAAKWNCVNSELIVQMCSFSLQPLALMIERLPRGPLNCFLRENRECLQVYHLLECGLFLTSAVNYLHDQKIVHGNIRCRALYVVEAPPKSSFVIKLGDPFIDINVNNDRLWIAPEPTPSIDDTPMSVDIWATGTTLWEIFSYGIEPVGRNVNLLNRPLSCHSNLWTTIQKCWSLEPEERESPFHIHQHIQRLYQDYRIHTLSKMPPKDSTKENKVSKLISLMKVRRAKPKSYSYKNLEYFPGDQEYAESDNSDYESETDFRVILSSQLTTMIDGKEEILGRGQYGEVIKALYKRTSTEFVAVKRMNTRINQRPDIIKDMVREFQIMTALDHENIVSIVGIVKDPEVMLIMEYLSMGSLLKFIRSIERGNLDMRCISFVKYALDIVKGMEYLESKKVVHRDLAARNILMKSESWVKIADFGLAQALAPNEDTYMVTTPRYLPYRWYAPESIKSPPTFSHKSDVWSFGVTLWEIFSLGEMPKYPDIDNDKPMELLSTYGKGKRLACPAKGVPFTKEMWKLIPKCWSYSDVERMSFSELHLQIKSIFERKAGAFD